MNAYLFQGDTSGRRFELHVNGLDDDTEAVALMMKHGGVLHAKPGLYEVRDGKIAFVADLPT